MPYFGAAIGWEGKSFAVAVFALAIFLAVWQVWERRKRPKGLPREEARYFNDQDTRRLIVAAVLAITATGIWRGAALDRAADRAAKVAWAYNWFAVGLLLIALLLLAFYDWWAIGRYARRRRQDLIDAGLAELESIREHRDKPRVDDRQRNGSL